MVKRVQLQVIKVYEIDIEAETDEEAAAKAYKMQTLQIQEEGELVDVMIDFAEVIDGGEDNDDED